MGLFYGLLFACGMPSDSGEGLKRSARHATNLVKWLLQDWKEGKNSTNTDSDLNVFSKAFLALPVDYYRHMRLDLHVTGDERGGTREDACRIIVLILMKHLSEDGERHQFVMVEELLSTPQAQQAYDLWSARNISVQQQEMIKKNALSRQAEIANRQRQDAMAKSTGGVGGGQVGGSGDQDYDGLLLDDSENNNDDDDNNNNNNTRNKSGDDIDNKISQEDDKDDDSYYDPDENDVMAAIRRRQKKARKEAEAMAGKDGKSKGKGGSNAAAATRWEDSQVSREQAARAASAAARRSGQHDTVRDSQDAAAEAAERQEEKSKLMGRDPLGILNFEDYDLRRIELKQAEQIEQALQEINEEIQKAENTGNEEILKKAVLQKESLEALVERMGGIEAMEVAVAVTTGTKGTGDGGVTTSLSGPTMTPMSSNQVRASILPTNPKFDPILFLTLLHRKTPYTTLIQSLDRLSRTYIS
jgi:Exocyst complex component Sec5